MSRAMRNRLKQFCLRLGEAHPATGFYLRRFYKGYFFNRIKKKIKGRQNVIRYKHAVLSSVWFDVAGDSNQIDIGDGCILDGVGFLIRGNHHRIAIGENCTFDKGTVLWFEDHHGALTVGAGSTFGAVHIAVTEPCSRIEIGNDCMFAYDIDVRTGDSHSIVDRESGERLNFARNISIGNHVWVGAHSIILKGVKVQDHSVVATGSVVTRAFDEANVVIAGNPAAVVKKNISWLRQRIEATAISAKVD